MIEKGHKAFCTITIPCRPRWIDGYNEHVEHFKLCMLVGHSYQGRKKFARDGTESYAWVFHVLDAGSERTAAKYDEAKRIVLDGYGAGRPHHRWQAAVDSLTAAKEVAAKKLRPAAWRRIVAAVIRSVKHYFCR